MKDKIHKIIFQNKKYLLIGDKKTGGAITTKEQYENFEISYAYLNPNGKILRYGKEIGDIKDIKFIKNSYH